MVSITQFDHKNQFESPDFDQKIMIDKYRLLGE